MRAQNFKYFFVEGARSFWINRLMSFAAVIIVLACLTAFGCYITVALNMPYVVNQVGGQYQLQVFMDFELTDQQMEEIGEELGALPHVTEATYVSSTDALSEAKELFGEDSALLDGLENDNPIHPSFKLTLEDLHYANNVAAEAEKLEHISSVKNDTNTVSRLVHISDIVKRVSLIFMLVLAFFAVFIISSTIRLTVYARRKDIKIMKFLGATDWFIRWPFVIEGALIGLIGGIIAFGLTALCYWRLAIGLSDLLGFVSLQPLGEVVWLLLGLVLGFGVLLGALGCILSMRRYLRV